MSMRRGDKVVPDFEQLVKLPPPRRSCVPAPVNGALGRLLAEAGISPRSVSSNGAELIWRQINGAGQVSSREIPQCAGG